MAKDDKDKSGKGDESEKKGLGKRKLLFVMLPLIGLSFSAYYFLVVAKSGPEKPAEPVPGEVVTLEPIQINLAGGHYLKVGLALQMSAEAAGHEPDGAKALHAAINLFTGEGMEDLSRLEQREKLREELVKKLDKEYHHEVIDVYFTEFVTQ